MVSQAQPIMPGMVFLEFGLKEFKGIINQPPQFKRGLINL